MCVVGSGEVSETDDPRLPLRFCFRFPASLDVKKKNVRPDYSRQNLAEVASNGPRIVAIKRIL